MKFLMTLLSTVWIAMMGTIAAQAETDKPAVTEMILGDVNAPIEIIDDTFIDCLDRDDGNNRSTGRNR